MKSLLKLTALALALAAVLPSSASAAAQNTRAIVVFNPTVAESERRYIVQKCGAGIYRELSLLPAIVVTVPSHQLKKVQAEILAFTAVKRFEIDTQVHTALIKQAPKVLNNPKAAQEITWGIARIDAPAVWKGSTGVGIKIAVLDTGIDVKHPDLIENLKGGINIVHPLSHFDDDNGHGTHVAGTIAAADNAIGVKGVAFNSKLYAVKILDKEGKGWISDVIAGLEWARDNHMKIINMSFATATQSPTLQEAVNEIYNAGIVQVAAAGSEGTSVYFPAAYEETIAVSAVDKNIGIASWSNTGERIDLIAPGEAVYSTQKGGVYATLSGTGMAAAHVSGTAALILENQPFVNPEKVRFYLTSTAEPLSLSNDQQGSGLLDAQEAALISEPNPQATRFAGKFLY